MQVMDKRCFTEGDWETQVCEGKGRLNSFIQAAHGGRRNLKGHHESNHEEAIHGAVAEVRLTAELVGCSLHLTQSWCPYI